MRSSEFNGRPIFLARRPALVLFLPCNQGRSKHKSPSGKRSWRPRLHVLSMPPAANLVGRVAAVGINVFSVATQSLAILLWLLPACCVFCQLWEEPLAERAGWEGPALQEVTAADKNKPAERERQRSLLGTNQPESATGLTGKGPTDPQQTQPVRRRTLEAGSSWEEPPLQVTFGAGRVKPSAAHPPLCSATKDLIDCKCCFDLRGTVL